MAIKKSELYSSLWASCDELRGSMDASQYKDYVLVLLFMKYVSDKGGALVDIPKGGSFKDMVNLKGQSDIGDKINKIIGELAKANDLTGVITVADFNDDEKLGKGKEKVDRLSNLIEIFEKPELDFSSNRAEGDDILGDAYEYLMRHFATESGKSKGQFYTPAEVSRIMAKVIGINPHKITGQTTVYDPTPGSGSLLLKVADEAGKSISIYGQENDNATRALAVMNMWLHGNPASEIVQGNTLASPQFTDESTGGLKQFDYAVANPPFSHKAWMNGWNPANDIYKRFEGYDALPPKKNGDFAFLLHLIKSLKSKGKGFIKDGNKNRLREQDIHKIVDAFNNRIEIPKYSRIIPISEIADPKNDYNLNIPRYIDSQEAEDLQDIEAHLLGDIPNRDIDDLCKYWEVYPTLKSALFKPCKRKNYSALSIAKEEIKNTIFHHPEFTAFSKKMDAVFDKWKKETTAYTKALSKGLHPKQEIHKISENLLKHYTGKQLTDKYAMYQHLMDYWAETMQDDMYELAADGWKAGSEVKRIEKKTKKGDKEVVKQVAGIEGLEGMLIPPALIIQEYFAKEQKAIDDLEAQAETLNARIDAMREEYGGEDGLLANAIDDKGKISKGNLTKAIKELRKRNADNAEEYDMLGQYKKLMDDEAEALANIKTAKADLEKKVIAKYPKLSIDEIKTIVVEKKWMHSIEQRIRTEMDNISHRLTQRIKELAERYEATLPALTNEVDVLEKKVNIHLESMGFVWK